MKPTRFVSAGVAAVSLVAWIAVAPPASAATCESGGPCVIGDVGPGGGIVFISPSTVGNTTGKFFEAALNTWNGSAPDASGQWCNASNASIAGLGNLIGDGEPNTGIISATCVSTGTNNAARYISERTIGGLSDWFLPSRDEMLALYDQRALLTGPYATNQAHVDVARYLTSSQDASPGSPLNAIGVYMVGSSFPGTAQGLSKQFNFSLRPVRMFTATEGSGSLDTAGNQVTPPDVIQQV